MYTLNKHIQFTCGFDLSPETILDAIFYTNNTINELPITLFKTIDFKTTSAMIGCIFCEAISKFTNSIVNPIEKGHPDIVPPYAINSTEEELKNFPVGLEIKCTIGNVTTGANLRAGESRIAKLTSVTWQAHHQEVDKLMGLTWDFVVNKSNVFYPMITGVFYSNNLTPSDWGAISGTTGRNTKVCGMSSSGKIKMGIGWVAILDMPSYINKYTSIFKFNLS